MSAINLPVEIIRLPVDRDGQCVHDDDQIEEFTYGAMKLIGSSRRPEPNLRIQIAQHDDGLWMWSTSIFFSGGGSTYRVGPKWGKFTRTRADAIVAACKEIEERNETLPPIALEWLQELCGAKAKQMELFA